MPIHLDVFHPNRIVVIVARGAISSEDITKAVTDFIANGAIHYRKIIDVTGANAEMDMTRLETIIATLRAAPVPTRGPLAFVVDPARNAWARKFVEMTAEDRPVKAFNSLHDARRWLDEVSTVEGKR